jgi:hypothetical protein
MSFPRQYFDFVHSNPRGPFMARQKIEKLSDPELLAYVGKRIPSLKPQAAAAWLGDLASDDPTASEEDPPFEADRPPRH